MIVARVRRTIHERALIAPGTRVLAACSGGPDSAAMLIALARLASDLDYELQAASVDHGLREDAALDVAIAAEQAAAAGVPFHALRVVVDPHASLQQAARSARYAALHALAARLGAARIAVGHTQDDQAETVLIRTLRGAGLAGLSGVEPLRGDGVIRPLIDCRRADVVAFAAQHCSRVASDPSNLDARFERVRVRHDVLPRLEAEDPAAVQHLADLADEARGASDVLRAEAEALLALSEQCDESIDVSLFIRAAPVVRRWALRAWLERKTGAALGRAQLTAADHALAAPAEIWLADGWVLRSDGEGRLVLLRNPGRPS
ncbi:MAG: tRNA lysidine(34) synthetase TilS [Polyangiales bacterium]